MANFFKNIRKKIANRFRQWALGSLQWAGADFARMSYYAAGSARTAEQWLCAYKTISQVRAPVGRIAKDVAKVPYLLKRKTSDTVGMDGKVPAEIVTGHPILDLLKRPNPHMTRSQFFNLLIVYLEMTGRAPIHIEFGRDGKPTGLYPIPPHRLLKIPTSDKPYFEVQTVSGKLRRYNPDEVIWLAYPDVLDPYGLGSGQAEAVDDEVTAVQYTGRWNNNLFRQGCHPGKIVSVEGMEPETQEKMQAAWESKFTGVDNAHRTLFVDGSVKVAQLNPVHKELDFNATVQTYSDRIRFNWSVPPELLGDIRNSNRATAQVANNLHQSNNLEDRVHFLEEHFNLYLVPLWGDSELFLEWANPVKEAKELTHQYLTEGWDKGLVKRDEWRRAHDMDPFGDPLGEQLLIPLNMEVVSSTGEVLARTGEQKAQFINELSSRQREEISHVLSRAAALYR